MSPNKFIMKICSNLMKLILYHEFYYFFLYNFNQSSTYFSYQKARIAFFYGWREYFI